MKVSEEWLINLLNKIADEVVRHAREGCPVCQKLANEWGKKAMENEKK